MDNSNDLSVFEEIVRELKDDFQENPFQYGNEQPILGELYHRLRGKLADVNLPVEFVTDYGNKKKWRVRKARALQNKGNVYRVRTEVSFIHEGERLQLPKHTKGKELGHRVFDLAIFSSNQKLVMHSKKPGPGDFWDTKNSISVLCEVKHSRNMVSRFYSEKHGAKDVTSLAAYPGEAKKRLFLFFDWWPTDSRNEKQYSKRMEKLKRNIQIPVRPPVEVVYIPRTGLIGREQIKRNSPSPDV